jgi:hypothetical protein
MITSSQACALLDLRASYECFLLWGKPSTCLGNVSLHFENVPEPEDISKSFNAAVDLKQTL